MRKHKFKIIKCIILYILLTVETFASIISDNDGSAFVTKSEFEALKNNFSMQIDNYNDSIDEKIDGAIASYLAGTQLLKKTPFDGFVEVTGSKPQIYGRKKDYETIKKQFWNELTCNMTVFGTAAGTAASYLPFYSNSNGGFTDGQYSYWIFKVQSAKSPYKYMKGYQFDTNGVITKIYEEDQVIITISDTACYDTWGRYMGVLNYVNKDTFTSQTLETGKLYTNALNIPEDRLSQENAHVSSSEVLNHYSEFLFDVDNNEKYTGTGPAGAAYSGKDGRGTLCLANTFYAEHFQNTSTEVNNYINTYNSVDATIYAYPKDAKKLEVFCDPLSTYDISSRGRRWQLAMYTNDDSFLLGQLSGYSWYNGIGSDGVQRENNVAHRYGLYVPKLKLKNDTTIDKLKPIITAPDDTEARFNNLNQFRNGYMSYTDKDGKKCYPYFYGGVPLFNMDNLTEKVSFKIRINATTSGVNKIRLWVKQGEFPNANYNPTSSDWTATNPMTGNSHNDDLVKGLKVNDVESTNKYVDIDAGTTVTIEVEEPKVKTPYFLRFSEINSSGTVLNEGGKIVSLTDFEAYTS